MSDKEFIRPIDKHITTGTSDSVLASLFRTILFDLNITNAKFNMLLEKYMTRLTVSIGDQATTSLRGNIKKELLKSTMSWKVFIKSLLFLNIKKFEIVIRLHHANTVITEHTKMVNLDGTDNDNDY